jgi:hypothetical protein
MKVDTSDKRVWGSDVDGSSSGYLVLAMFNLLALLPENF